MILNEQEYRYTYAISPALLDHIEGEIPELGFTYKETLALKIDEKKFHFLFRRNGEKIRLPRRKDTLHIGASAPSLPYLINFLPSNDRLLDGVKPVLKFFEKVQYYPLDEPNESLEKAQIVQGAEYDGWLAQYRNSGFSGDSILKKLIYLHENDHSKFAFIEAEMGEGNLNLLNKMSVGSYSIPEQAAKPSRHGSPTNERAARFFYTYFVPHSITSDNFAGLAFRCLSLGTRRVMRLFVSLVFDDSPVILLEHPEDAIHSGLTRRLIAEIKRFGSGRQIFATTHSHVILNTVAPEDIRLVTMSHGITSVRSLSPVEIDAANQYISEDGPLSKFLDYVQED